MTEKSKIPKTTKNINYREKKIEITQSGTTHQCKVDGKIIETYQDADTGGYVSHATPYQQFGTLEELGKAVLDIQNDE